MENDVKKKFYTAKTIKQLKNEYFVSTNSSGMVRLLNLIDGVTYPVSNSHLASRAASLENSEGQGTFSTHVPIDSVISKLPHIVYEKYDPSSSEYLREISRGQYYLNTYKASGYSYDDNLLSIDDNGDVTHLVRGFKKSPPLFDEYMKRIFPNAGERDFMVRWMARTVMQPEYKIKVAPVLRGSQGAGKNVFITLLSTLCGRTNVLTTKLSHVTGSFNAGIASCVVCCLDETYARKSSSANRLKSLITEDYLAVTKKHMDTVPQPIYANFIILSNDEFPLQMDQDDRRYFVPEFMNHKVDKNETAKFIGDLFDWFNVEGAGELYDYLAYIDSINYKNSDGFIVNIETKSHTEIKNTDVMDEHIGDLVDFLKPLQKVRIIELKERFMHLPQPAIVKVLKAQRFVSKTITVDGSKSRCWVKKTKAGSNKSNSYPMASGHTSFSQVMFDKR